MGSKYLKTNGRVTSTETALWFALAGRSFPSKELSGNYPPIRFPWAVIQWVTESNAVARCDRIMAFQRCQTERIPADPLSVFRNNIAMTNSWINS
jgi:hypothetical protein